MLRVNLCPQVANPSIYPGCTLGDGERPLAMGQGTQLSWCGSQLCCNLLYDLGETTFPSESQSLPL